MIFFLLFLTFFFSRLSRPKHDYKFVDIHCPRYSCFNFNKFLSMAILSACAHTHSTHQSVLHWHTLMYSQFHWNFVACNDFSFRWNWKHNPRLSCNVRSTEIKYFISLLFCFLAPLSNWHENKLFNANEIDDTLVNSNEIGKSIFCENFSSNWSHVNGNNN